MARLIKQTVTEVTFMEHISTEDDMRALTLRYDSEGAGRFLVLSNGGKASEIYFDSPEDIFLIYETALQLWKQGDILFLGEADKEENHPPAQRSFMLDMDGGELEEV